MPAVLDRPAVTPAAEPTTRTDDELVILVTQEHIDRGEQGQANYCPLVLAANELGRGGWWSMTTGGVLEFLPQWPGPREYWRSWDAGNFAAAFDKDRGSVHPERFVFRRTAAEASQQ